MRHVAGGAWCSQDDYRGASSDNDDRGVAKHFLRHLHLNAVGLGWGHAVEEISYGASNVAYYRQVVKTARVAGAGVRALSWVSLFGSHVAQLFRLWRSRSAARTELSMTDSGEQLSRPQRTW